MDHPLNVTPTEDRLPAEQLIANAVRQVVYDPSVLVRYELAVLYARFVRGHSAFVLEALSAQSRRLSDFLLTHRQAQVEAQRAAAAAAAAVRDTARGVDDMLPLGRHSADAGLGLGRFQGGAGGAATSASSSSSPQVGSASE